MQVLDYYVVVRGLFGRNRATKFQTFRVHRADVSQPLDTPAALVLLETQLRAIKFKGGYIAIEERSVTLDGGAESYMLGEDRKLHAETR